MSSNEAAPRLRKVSTRKEFDGILDDYITQGYEVISQGESSALLRKKTGARRADRILGVANRLVYNRLWQPGVCSGRPLHG